METKSTASEQVSTVHEVTSWGISVPHPGQGKAGEPGKQRTWDCLAGRASELDAGLLT